MEDAAQIFKEIEKHREDLYTKAFKKAKKRHGPISNIGQIRIPGNSDIYDSNYNQDNDSSTDDESSDDDMESSDDDEGFISKVGKISTKTSSRGKVKISGALGEGSGEVVQNEEEEEDDFETEMNKELDERIDKAEKEAAISSTCPLPIESMDMEDKIKSKRQRLQWSSSWGEV